ncbi:MAG: cytochrome c oxidase subunit 2A, partial [Maribacter sp.]|nr:cytochrome c oxidase subunit 2A [Maribacter sp.]
MFWFVVYYLFLAQGINWFNTYSPLSR